MKKTRNKNTIKEANRKAKLRACEDEDEFDEDDELDEDNEYLEKYLEFLPEHSSIPPILSEEEMMHNTLSTHRVLYLTDEVSMRSVMPIIKRIHLYNILDSDTNVDSPILLFINSPGGEADAAWALIDAIQTSRVPVYTFNVASCYSAASYIFMAGKRRFVNAHSSFMIHRGEMELGANISQVFDFLAFYKGTMMKQVKEYVISHSKITEEMYAEHEESDWYMTAEESLQYGVSTEYFLGINYLVSGMQYEED